MRFGKLPVVLELPVNMFSSLVVLALCIASASAQLAFDQHSALMAFYDAVGMGAIV